MNEEHSELLTANTPVSSITDALLPPAMAVKAEQIGVKKAQMDAASLFLLAVLAGAFIALGAIFSTTVASGTEGKLPYGVVRLLAGLVFTLGLILVLIGGAELFTGNNLIVMAWASGKVTTGALLRNWGIVYLGNFAGSIATAAIMLVTGQHTFGNGSVGATALAIAQAKTSFGFWQAMALGMMCNALVCLAIWLCFSARSTTDKILVIIPPIAAFVAAGFEHSVANMYFVPMGLFIKSAAPDSFWTAIGKTAADFPALTWETFFFANLVPVTLGNMFGGSVMVGAVYWLIYLRKKDPASAT